MELTNKASVVIKESSLPVRKSFVSRTNSQHRLLELVQGAPELNEDPFEV
jgi:hypothetical protein